MNNVVETVVVSNDSTEKGRVLRDDKCIRCKGPAIRVLWEGGYKEYVICYANIETDPGGQIRIKHPVDQTCN